MSDLLKSYRFREERQADWQKLDLILTKAENGGVRRLSAPLQLRGFQQLRRGRALHHLARLMEHQMMPKMMR